MFSWGRSKQSSPASSSGRRGDAPMDSGGSSRRGSGSGSGSRGRSPRLERRNAAKHIDYEAGGPTSVSASWSSSASASSADRSPGVRPSRSLDLAARGGTDFRVSGSAEGEVDELCRSLGLSGPEDFAIPVAAWEARKARSSNDLLSRAARPDPDTSNPPLADPAPVVRTTSAPDGPWPAPLSFPDPIPEESIHSSATSTATATDSVEELTTSIPPPAESPKPTPTAALTAHVAGLSLLSPRKTTGEVGIRGVRPPLLSPPPPITGLAPPPVRQPSNGKFKRNIKPWMRGALLGSGSFGTVYEGISDEGAFFAVKEVSLLDQGSNAQQSILALEQEIALLSQFEHENIVQYYGTDKEESKLYIFIELVTQGSLSSLYQKYKLRDSQVSAYTRQILNGLVYLHDRNVVHRDIKCANILVHANGSVKLADFGLAKEMSKINMLRSCKGSVYWMAPEVVNPRKTYGPAADMWSLGCTVLEMLTRQIPYPNVEWTNAFFMIGRGEQPPMPSYLSKEAQDFIGQCVRVDPEERPTASELLAHPFVNRPLRASFDSLSPPTNRQ
ncbi:mitogen-activated protein kinase kinase kinase 1-like [Lolium rigidum]|uniref:mitogen-activated protein kinase kinase kinase 1-like n=1 Tax=Lolium rigidum TaxID=89674 RepID=UPI001F5DD886|nr:mitogen-activated protein kinase kinase kinase 1-like [Lolium rigidum]